MPQRKPSQRKELMPDYRYAGDTLRKRWERLHQGDCEPWPEQARVSSMGKRHAGVRAQIAARGGAAAVAVELQEAWRDFHAGEFAAAIKRGSALGAIGAAVANKAAGVDSLYSKHGDAQILQQLDSAVQRGEQAATQLPDYANAHYTLALVLGRYSQRISILRALAQGLAGRVHSHLQRTLALEPRHAEAHVALGLYHAEIINKLGALAASLTYGASRDQAIEHFQQAIKFAPKSPIVNMEYANGLRLLDAQHYHAQIATLYQQAAACKPLDAMERLDTDRASQGPE
jgi:tetratricopeptide (TPR) repeat protein